MTNIADYLAKYGLKESHVYLLELIPLIEMIWADGQNQEAEVKLLYRYTIEHLGRISKEAPGTTVITEAEINEFLDRFCKTRPSAAMLEDLRSACIDRIDQTPQSENKIEQKNAILNYCMDIAAACVARYPYRFDERIVKKEKALLMDLFNAMAR